MNSCLNYSNYGNYSNLNLDNIQIWSAELSQYEVNWLKYNLKIPVIPQKENKDEQG